MSAVECSRDVLAVDMVPIESSVDEGPAADDDAWAVVGTDGDAWAVVGTDGDEEDTGSKDDEECDGMVCGGAGGTLAVGSMVPGGVVTSAVVVASAVVTDASVTNDGSRRMYTFTGISFVSGRETVTITV